MGKLHLPRTLAAILAMLALALSALVPQGYMPVRGEEGVSITLCSGSRPVTVQLQADDPLHAQLQQLARLSDTDSRTFEAFADGQGGEHHPDKAHNPCPYAAMVHLASLAAPAMLSAAPMPAMAMSAQPIITLPPAGVHIRIPPATGPPAIFS